MRVINEEVLQLFLEETPTDWDESHQERLAGAVWMLNVLLDRFVEDIDQLEVTNLRPMSDLYKYEPLDVFMFCKRCQELVYAKYDSKIDEYIVLEEGPYPVAFDNYDGWIPVPSYKPE